MHAAKLSPAGWLALFALLTACGKSLRGAAQDGASGGVGGVMTATAGAASGPSGGGSAGVNRGGSAGNPATDSDGRPLPIAGEHEIQELGCYTAPIDQAYLVQPVLECRVTPGSAPTTEICAIMPYCTRHSDCDAQPFGLCQGSVEVGCHYRAEPCSTDTDCNTRDNGHCLEALTEQRCDGDGNCWPQGAECYYAPEACETDADCVDGAEGRCEKIIWAPRCTYADCAADSDCAAGQRCACESQVLKCVPANCSADSDCPTGRRCRLQNGCFALEGSYCTSADDTCAAADDCATQRCEYSKDRWECNPAECPID